MATSGYVIWQMANTIRGNIRNFFTWPRGTRGHRDLKKLKSVPRSARHWISQKTMPGAWMGSHLKNTCISHHREGGGNRGKNKSINSNDYLKHKLKHRVTNDECMISRMAH